MIHGVNKPLFPDEALIRVFLFIVSVTIWLLAFVIAPLAPGEFSSTVEKWKLELLEKMTILLIIFW